MRSYIPKPVREQAAKRAGHCCEYCKISDQDTYFGFEVDHVVSRKHGGSNSVENLAYTCFLCNRHKGSDIGSLNKETGEFTRFFNPRIDIWKDHFSMDGAFIIPRTAIGEVTIAILQFNSWARVQERENLIIAGRYTHDDIVKKGD